MFVAFITSPQTEDRWIVLMILLKKMEKSYFQVPWSLHLLAALQLGMFDLYFLALDFLLYKVELDVNMLGALMFVDRVVGEGNY